MYSRRSCDLRSHARCFRQREVKYWDVFEESFVLEAESDRGDARLRSTSSTEINRQLYH